jgi:hypothetical protein
MLKVKIVLLSLFAMFAMSAVMAATASATHTFKVEGTEITKTEEVEADSFSGKLETMVAKLPLAIQCEEDVSGTELVIQPAGTSTGGINFKNCFVVEFKEGKKGFVTTCTVTEPVEAKFTDQLTEHGVDVYKGSKPLEGFVELELKGASCAIKGKYPVKGSQNCATPEAELNKVIHESICTPSGSKLAQEKEGTEVAAALLYGTEQIKLKSGKSWSAS